jgi:2,3-bisphosphoglycerate-independent phosphoglycerate mutase
MTAPQPVLLVILDGWGIAPPGPGNAVRLAEPACFNRLWAQGPATTLLAGDEDVGLPAGQFGNSEVGHMNLGAGRVVYQDITRIDRDIRSGAFFELAALKQALAATQPRDPHKDPRGGRIHLFGLVSDGGVHSSDRHYFALIDWLKLAGYPGDRVFFHAVTDGRDTAPTSGAGHVRRLIEKLDETGIGRVASISGRYYAMDRDQRWDRTERYFDAITLGQAEITHDATGAIEASYARGVTDEFIVPHLVVEHGEPLGRLRDGDVVVAFDFRADRMRQICRALTRQDFAAFRRRHEPVITLVSMTRYAPDIPALVCYEPQGLSNTLGEWLSSRGVGQFRTAETEKYAHVTYFFNGGREEPFAGEERALVPSPKVATYDLKPEMSAPEVASGVVAAIASGRFPFVLVNFANPDMTGHTGILEAAIAGCKAADEALERCVSTAVQRGYSVLVTADHGNADEMLVSAQAASDPANQEKGASYGPPKGFTPREDGLVPSTQHSRNPVPFVLAGRKPSGARLAPGGRLCDVAPTVLTLMGIDKPPEMTGRNLLD